MQRRLIENGLAAFFGEFEAKLPVLTDWVCRAPWLVAAVPLAATVCAGVALGTNRRIPLVAAWGLVLLSAVVVVVADIALQLPMQALVQSIMGG
jgi:hypothetical protein